MTAEYWRSFRATRVTMHEADRGDRAGHPEPAEHAAVAVVDRAVEHRHHARPATAGPAPRTARSTRSSGPARASGPRPRPGCTRYQWPSSMASVTGAEEGGADQDRAGDRAAVGPPASTPAATRPTHADDRGDQVEAGRELRRRRRRSRCRGPVDAGHGRDPGRAGLAPAARCPATPGPLADDRHDERDARRPARRRPAASVPDQGRRRPTPADPRRRRRPCARRCRAAASRSRGRPPGGGSSPTGRARPPVAHCSRTVAASRRIIRSANGFGRAGGRGRAPGLRALRRRRRPGRGRPG